MFNPAVDAAAKAHAIAEYPKEACGVVCGDPAVYLALPNMAADPQEQFELPSRALIDHSPVLAVVHSHCHPRHDQCPTALDMTSQLELNIPFGIVWTDGKEAGAPLWFGDFLLDVPLFDAKGNHLQRPFMHGVTDCLSLIRSWYWQKKQIRLPEFPRDKDWWKHGGDLYRAHFSDAGFHAIAPEEAQPDDVVLMKWGKWAVPFHGGVLLNGGLILHHKQNRLSCREPFPRWVRCVTHYLRHG